MGLKGNERNSQENCSRLLSELRLFLAGEIMGSVAHDLNNPLSVLMGRAEIIARAADNATPDLPKIKESVERIVPNCRRMAELIHAVRMVASVDSKVAVPPILLEKVYERVLVLTKKKLGYSNVELILESEEPKFTVEQSESWLLQVFVSLVLGANNALESLQSEKRWIRISILENKPHWTLTVRDSGPLDPQGEMLDLLSERRSRVRDVRFYALARELANEVGAQFQIRQNTEFEVNLEIPIKMPK